MQEFLVMVKPTNNVVALRPPKKESKSGLEKR